MFIPIGDTPNPPNFRPWMNFALIAANVLVYLLVSLPLAGQPVDLSDPALAQYLLHFAPSLPSWKAVQLTSEMSAYDLFVFVHGYKPGLPSALDLIASLFLHGGFLHLAGNMLFLYIFGDNVEHRVGRFGYLVIYLATGVLATLSFSLLAGDSMVPLVGASGAISGVLGLYFLLFPRNRVRVFVFLFPFLMDVFLVPVRWMLGFYVLVDNLLPLILGSASGVAYGAHLGGFLAGLGVAAVGERLGWSARVRPRSQGADSTVDLGPDDCVALAAKLEANGQGDAASRLLRRCLASQANSEEKARVFLALGLLRLSQGQVTSAYQHLLDVFDYDPDPATAARARAALAQIKIRRGFR